MTSEHMDIVAVMRESDRKRAEWLAGLKPGDRVMYRLDGQAVIGEVLARHKNGNIIVGQKYKCNFQGICDWGYDRLFIEPVDTDMVRRERLAAKLRGLRWERVSKYTLDRIADALSREREEVWR